jgi:signal peptidase I
MKRAIALAFLFFACIAGFLTIKGTLPFMPIYGSSMEPTLQSGSLLTINPVNPNDIKVGDIIIYNVPKMVREYYNYPSVVSHRVIEIKTTPSLGFRTKGDNTSEDPFTIRPIDIRGTVGKQIPYLGLPLLFFQSQQGAIFAIIALALLAIFLYGGELLRGGSTIHHKIFSPVINEEKRNSRVLTRKIEATEKKIDTTEQALNSFSTAIGEYAQHLASHTSAVKSLAEASLELKKGAAEQNRVLMALVENMVKPREAQEAPVHKIEPTATLKPLVKGHPAAGKPTPQIPRQKAIEEIKPQPETPKTVSENVKPLHTAPNKPAPPGCARKHDDLPEDALAAEEEIFSALDRLHSRLNKDKNQA